MKRILLTGVGSPASQNFLQCLRLAHEPLYIVGADANRYHLEWGELDARYESPLTSHPGYLDWLNRLIDREEICFLHGQPDYEVAFLSAHAELLHARTFYPPAAVIELAQDKCRANAVWGDIGLRRDVSWAITAREGLPEHGYPLWMRATKGTGSRGARLVGSRQEAVHWLALCQMTNPDWQFMLEEYLPGTEYAWHGLFHRGGLVASSTREFVEKPMSQHLGGAAVSSSYIVAKTIDMPDVAIIGEAAVRALDACPHGSYGVDLKRDREGIVRPTECNAGRFKTTSLFLAKAGCNMPYLFVLLGCGGSTEPGHYWIRHNDVESAFVREGEWRSVPLEATL